MNIRLARWAATAAAAALLFAGCAPDRAPTASQPSNGNPRALLGLGTPQLLECPTQGYGSVTQEVGPEGGTITVGPHSLVIPPGALASTVSITATAPAGPYVDVQFQPTGLQFAQPASLTLSYKGCGVLGILGGLDIAYINDQFDILQLLPSLPNILTETVSAPINHFSGYVIAY